MRKDDQEITRFAGHELIQALADLKTSSFIGPWALGDEKRQAKGKFRPSAYPESFHPHVELCHVLSGQCTLSYRHKPFLLEKGDLAFLGPKIPHAETYRKKTIPYRLAWWLFEHDSVLVHVTDYTAKNGFRLVDRVVLKPLAHEAKEACNRLIRLASANSLPEELPVKESLLVLAVFLLRKIMTGTGADRVSARRHCVEQAEDYIRKHLDRPLNLSEVANAVRLSPNYLTALFHTETGVALGHFIKRERVAKAKELLAETRKSVKEIGLGLGFEDPYTFSRAFKRVAGMSPQRYRQVAG